MMFIVNVSHSVTHYGITPPCGIDKKAMAFGFVREYKKYRHLVTCPDCLKLMLPNEVKPPARECLLEIGGESSDSIVEYKKCLTCETKYTGDAAICPKCQNGNQE